MYIMNENLIDEPVSDDEPFAAVPFIGSTAPAYQLAA
jgi:hypothetical protein